MTRFARIRRRPDHWASAHERARARAAERLDGPLGLAEATWLDEHLSDCPPCAAVAVSYDADRLSLRALRETQPEPPRDLWARTAAGIERQARTRPASSGSGSTDARPTWKVPLGAVSGLAVIAIVVGVTTLSGNLFAPAAPAGTPAPIGAGPALAPGSAAPVASGADAEPTPIAVGAGDVAWLDGGTNRPLAYANAGVDEVCPTEGTARCANLDEDRREAMTLTSTPRTIIGSPTDDQAVAIAANGDHGDQLIIVRLPAADTGIEPSPPPTPTTAPTETPKGSASPTTSPPAMDPSIAPAPTPSVQVTVVPSTDPLASTSPGPEPTVAISLAIASGIDVVGESAAYSRDGTWFAFTARPADGTGGPDVYVWRVGDERARPLTTGGSTYFASWANNVVVASRPEDGSDSTADPVTVRIDPATGVESEAGTLWRPIVDPTGRLAIGWDGTLVRIEADRGWVPAKGQLELQVWPHEGNAAENGQGSSDRRVVTDEAAGDFDVRWDETGEWVAVWVADPRDASIGRLTLYKVEVARQRLEQVDGAPVEVPALPGVSIGDGRLAWATPRGQGGEGSRIQIAAWSASGVGTVESDPGEDLVVVQ